MEQREQQEERSGVILTASCSLTSSSALHYCHLLTTSSSSSLSFLLFYYCPTGHCSLVVVVVDKYIHISLFRYKIHTQKKAHLLTDDVLSINKDLHITTFLHSQEEDVESKSIIGHFTCCC